MAYTIGTGAQAWANLTEYRDVFSTLPEETRRAFIKLTGRVILWIYGLTGEFIGLAAAGLALMGIPSTEARRLAQLARLTTVWTVLMLGSTLVLAGAAIQLGLRYMS